ncbi:hypothetical protein M0R45_004443 [Rubus argutus]|uniref:RING-type E3 ubiquitin transferase n=1 Tax=Rubus argutus TaxID=59490 RepID=A0AAW1YJR7_RUBAR
MSSSGTVLLILFTIAFAASLLLYYLLRHLRNRSQPLRHTAAAPLQHSHSRRRRVSPAPAPASSADLILPRFKFSDVTRTGSVTVAGDCAICLAEFQPDHQLRLLPQCLHAFHVECIDTWLAGESQICPVCRSGIPRSDSDLLLRASACGSFRLAIGNVSRGRRPDAAANSSARSHSIHGGEFEYVVDEEWELQLRDAVLPVHEEEEEEIVAVVIDHQPPSPPPLESSFEYQVFTGSSRRWTELADGLEMISRWLSLS